MFALLLFTSSLIAVLRNYLIHRHRCVTFFVKKITHVEFDPIFKANFDPILDQKVNFLLSKIENNFF